MFNLGEATREELTIDLMPLKLSTLFFKLYVHLGLDVSICTFQISKLSLFQISRW